MHSAEAAECTLPKIFKALQRSRTESQAMRQTRSDRPSSEIPSPEALLRAHPILIGILVLTENASRDGSAVSREALLFAGDPQAEALT